MYLENMSNERRHKEEVSYFIHKKSRKIKFMEIENPLVGSFLPHGKEGIMNSCLMRKEVTSFLIIVKRK
jgi:hypothetical protein